MPTSTPRAEDRRRRAVLESALETFARTGYRATSMDAVARAAKISRPGLYYLFESKEALFREAASHVLARDLDEVERLLATQERPVEDRLVDAFDQWAGRYVGPLAREVPTVVAENAELLDDVAREAPARFRAMLAAAVESALPDARGVAETLESVSVGLLHQVETRDAYRVRLRTAVELIVRAARAGAS